MSLRGPELNPPEVATVNEALERAAQSSEGLTFVDLQERERVLPFRDLQSRARRRAAALQALGIEPGDRVGIILPTGEAFMDAFFGTLLAGAVPVPLYPPLRLGRLDEYHCATAQMLRRVEAKVVLTDARVRRLLGQTMAGARPAQGCIDVETLHATDDATLEHPVDASALGLIQFSSGSTVDPKPVALTHRALLAQCATLRALLPEATRQCGVSWLPLYHDMGLIGCLLSAVYYPGPMVLLAPESFLAKPALWLRAISRHRASISPAPNFAYGLCLKRVRDEDLEGVDLSSWRAALNGAEPVSLPTVRRFCERFARYGLDASAVLPVYGMSEASLAVTFSPAGEPAHGAHVDPQKLAREKRVAPGEREIASVGKLPTPRCAPSSCSSLLRASRLPS
ncbi:MAG: AMP-binding protein [Myxococcaceae bacterium]